MPKISSELMEKLKGQVASMRGGVLIDNKTLVKARFRLLPCFDELPGKEYVSVYYVSAKKSTTSPKTWGLPDPIIDILDEARREKSKEEIEAINKVVRVQREYWVPVIDRANPGTPENPNIRIFRAKPKYVYQPIVDAMLDDDDGEDITDPVEGRDIRVKKEGKELSTEWSVKFLDRTPLHDDKKMLDAIVEAAKTFDVARYFYAVDKALMQQIYMHLTGEDIPEKYMAVFSQIPKLKKPEDGDAGDDDDAPVAATASDDDATAAAETASDDDAPVAATASEESAEGELKKGMLVKFEYEDAEVVGEVQSTSVDEEGDNVADVVVAGVAGVADGTVFTVGVEGLTVVPPEEKKPVKPKIVTKPKPAPKPAPKPIVGKAKPTASSTLKAKMSKK